MLDVVAYMVGHPVYIALLVTFAVILIPVATAIFEDVRKANRANR